MAPPAQDDVIQAEILQAALRLYRKFGPEKVAMDDVAKAAGRSRTSLYYYYKNRNEILQAALDTVVQGVARDIRRSVAEAVSLEEKVYAFCVTKLKSSREWKLILNAVWTSINPDEQSGHLKVLEGLHQNLVRQESIILKEILACGLENNEIRQLTADEQDRWVFVITSSIRGIRNEILDQNLTPQFKAAIRVLSDMAVRWLKV